MTNQRSRILYVDDEPDIQQIVKISLEELGNFEVTIASSGAEAIESLRTHYFDLLMIDFMMPQLTGPETIRAIHLEKLNCPPFVLITAKAYQELNPAEIPEGCIDIISKPFNPYFLATRIEAAIKARSSLSDGLNGPHRSA